MPATKWGDCNGNGKIGYDSVIKKGRNSECCGEFVCTQFDAVAHSDYFNWPAAKTVAQGHNIAPDGCPGNLDPSTAATKLIAFYDRLSSPQGYQERIFKRPQPSGDDIFAEIGVPSALANWSAEAASHYPTVDGEEEALGFETQFQNHTVNNGTTGSRFITKSSGVYYNVVPGGGITRCSQDCVPNPGLTTNDPYNTRNNNTPILRFRRLYRKLLEGDLPSTVDLVFSGITESGWTDLNGTHTLAAFDDDIVDGYVDEASWYLTVANTTQPAFGDYYLIVHFSGLAVNRGIVPAKPGTYPVRGLTVYVFRSTTVLTPTTAASLLEDSADIIGVTTGAQLWYWDLERDPDVDTWDVADSTFGAFTGTGAPVLSQTDLVSVGAI